MAKKTKQEAETKIEMHSTMYIKSRACYGSTDALGLYVKLLTSKVPRNELKGKKVLFVGMGNEGIVRRFRKELGLDEVYVLCDFGESTEYFDEKCKTLGNLLLSGKDLSNSLKRKMRTMVKSLGMKFDIVIANPPYNTPGHPALHLEIMQAVLESGCLNKGYQVVSIQPVNWLLSQSNKRINQGYYKKYEAYRKNIKQIDYVSKDDADKIFDIAAKSHLGIYVCGEVSEEDNQKCIDDFFAEYAEMIDDTSFFDNVTVACAQHRVKTIETVLRPLSEGKKYFCKLSGVHGNIGRLDYYNTVAMEKENVRGNKVGSGKKGTRLRLINFDSDEEAENFRLTLNGKFYRYANACYKTGIDLHYNYLPFMGEAINPRTGVVGYKGEWTDEDLFTYFGIPKEEQCKIMEKLTKWEDEIIRKK